MSLEINEYFKNQYLTCGNTYDNFVFHNCPKELLNVAEQTLSEGTERCTPIVLRIDKQIEDRLSQTLDACSDDFQRGVFARTYFSASVMREMLNKFNTTFRHHTIPGIDSGIEKLLGGDFEGSKRFYFMAPFFEEIQSFVRKNGRIELDLLLDDTSNVFLQRAINDSLASRTSFSIKVFNTGKGFVTSYTNNGQIVQNTHYYMTRNVEDYISCQEENVM